MEIPKKKSPEEIEDLRCQNIERKKIDSPDLKEPPPFIKSQKTTRLSILPLLIAIYLSIIYPLFAFAGLANYSEDEQMLFALAMIVFSIVSGVFMWRADIKGPLLSKIFCIITLSLNFVAIIIFVRESEGAKVFAVLIASIVPSLILSYLITSSNVKKIYGELDKH